MPLSISRVSFEHHHRALGISETQPRISWRFQGTVVDWEQTSYEIQVRRDWGNRLRSFRFSSPNSLFVPWPDEPLQATENAQVRVRAHGKPGQASTPWSAWETVEAGLLSVDDWAGAMPITTSQTPDDQHDGPKRPIYFRKLFLAPSHVLTARLYITALGVYEAEINGDRVGDEVLAPGWQSYQHRHVYNTYDVTHAVRPGNNAIGVVAGEGWFSGKLGFGNGRRNHYGESIGVMALLVVRFADGTVRKTATDLSWKACYGPLLSSGLYDGEHYDSRLETDMEGWSSEPFDETGWLPVTHLPQPDGALMAPDGPPVKKIEERRPLKIFQSPSQKTILDFGQNLAGWLRISTAGSAGTKVTLTHAEVLEDGELSLRPLRYAKPVDSFILNGREQQTWEPRFTYHGFRFAQVDGWPEGVPLEGRITAVVIHSDMEQTGWFECSDTLLNKLHQNIRWSMKGNFVSIPTDCPQRDERLGWTGDALVFGPTSNFLYNTAGFWRSWHRDLWSEMQEGGKMVPPFFTPSVWTKFPSRPAAVWGDVAVAGPWNLYMAFGDKAMLREQYSQARAWVDTGIPRGPQGLWDRECFQFGDWLDPLAPPEDAGQATTSKHLVADAYLIRMTEILSRISAALGHEDVAARYQQQHAQHTHHFSQEWIRDGRMVNPTQTAYSLTLDFGIIRSKEAKNVALNELRGILARNGYLIGTGFAGTPSLGFALHKANATGDFYRVLRQTRVPSWLYQVLHGGTTTWERWDSLLPDGRVNPGAMTSFNHYAFGSVADWMHQVIGGIAPIEPGWRKFAIAPVPGGGITSASVRFSSSYGMISVEWWIERHSDAEPEAVHRNGFHLKALVPPNTRAEVTLPGQEETLEVGSGVFECHDPKYQYE